MRGYLLWTRDAWIIRQAKGAMGPCRDRGASQRAGWRLATSWGAEVCGDVLGGVYPGQLGSCAGLVRPTRREKCIVLCVRGPSWARVTVGAGALVGAPKGGSVVCGLWRVVCCVRWAGGRDEPCSREMQTSPAEQREPARATGGCKRTQPAARAVVAQPVAAEALVSSRSLRRALPQSPPSSWRRRGSCAQSSGSSGRRSRHKRRTRVSRARCRRGRPRRDRWRRRRRHSTRRDAPG